MVKNKQEFFKELKKRMVANNYEEYVEKVQAAKEKHYFINNKRLSREQLAELQRKIDEIAASEEFVFDPLNRIIVDENDYYSLDESGRMRYMLELSNLYLSVRNL